MIASLALASLCSSHALAQSDHLHTPAAPEKLTAAQQIPGGQVQLTDADYIVFAKDWNKKHKDPPAFTNWNPTVSCDAFDGQ